MENTPNRAGGPGKKKWLGLLLLGGFLLLLGGITYALLPYIRMLGEESTRAQFQGWIDGLGPMGWLVLLLIQVLQIIVAFIPGEPIEVLAGLLYGTVGGLLLCELGILLGSGLVYLLVRRFGKPFVHLFVSEEELGKFGFLKDAVKLEALTFLLFFIPGTPKDALTYLMPLTSIKPRRFFTISMIARIPSVLSSTWAGATLSNGNLWGTVLIFVGIGLVGVLGILYQKRFMARQEKKEEDKGQ